MAEAAHNIRDIVETTKAYYDGPADEIYRDIWGENVHIGYFEDPENEDLATAMHRSNVKQAEPVNLQPGALIHDVGCGYGALARFLAKNYGTRVLATNISEKELDWGRELTQQEGLEDKVSFEWADFHDLQYDDNSFDYYWSQEAFLHAVDKRKVLEEAYRVLKPGGKLVMTDLLVRDGTPDKDREIIYSRVNSPDMWDGHHYVEALQDIGFTIERHEDWSSNVAPTYGWVRSQLEKRRDEFEARIGKERVDETSQKLQYWVDSANAGKIGWEYFIARK